MLFYICSQAFTLLDDYLMYKGFSLIEQKTCGTKKVKRGKTGITYNKHCCPEEATDNISEFYYILVSINIHFIFVELNLFSIKWFVACLIFIFSNILYHKQLPIRTQASLVRLNCSLL